MVDEAQDHERPNSQSVKKAKLTQAMTDDVSMTDSSPSAPLNLKKHVDNVDLSDGSSESATDDSDNSTVSDQISNEEAGTIIPERVKEGLTRSKDRQESISTQSRFQTTRTASGKNRKNTHNPSKQGRDPDKVRMVVGGILEWKTKKGEWIPAVEHKNIRKTLIEKAALRGSYTYDRLRGQKEHDETSFLVSQKDWNRDPERWPDVLKVEGDGYRSSSLDSRTPPEWYDEQGRIILGADDAPIREFKYLPATISSQIEPFFIEAVQRLDSRITIFDIWVRMPPELGGMTMLRNRRNKWLHDYEIVSWKKPTKVQVLESQATRDPQNADTQEDDIVADDGDGVSRGQPHSQTQPQQVTLSRTEELAQYGEHSSTDSSTGHRQPASQHSEFITRQIRQIINNDESTVPPTRGQAHHRHLESRQTPSRSDHLPGEMMASLNEQHRAHLSNIPQALLPRPPYTPTTVDLSETQLSALLQGELEPHQACAIIAANRQMKGLTPLSLMPIQQIESQLDPLQQPQAQQIIQPTIHSTAAMSPLIPPQQIRPPTTGSAAAIPVSGHRFANPNLAPLFIPLQSHPQSSNYLPPTALRPLTASAPAGVSRSENPQRRPSNNVGIRMEQNAEGHAFVQRHGERSVGTQPNASRLESEEDDSELLSDGDEDTMA